MASLIVSLDVKGRKVLLGSYQMIPEDADQKSDVRTFRVGGASFRMIRVKAGSFMMGCDDEIDGNFFDRAKPKHKVNLTRDYWIAETELTRAVYRAVMGAGLDLWQDVFFSYGAMKDDSLPAVCLTWNMAQTFIDKLNILTGEKFRFPTEAEWEFAARGGVKSDGFVNFPGSDWPDDVAWANGMSRFYPVGMKKPNELGLYDMGGNAFEWCSDWYGPYSAEDQTDPVGPDTGDYKIIRGGDIISSYDNVLVYFRNYVDISVDLEDMTTTVRLALTVPEVM